MGQYIIVGLCYKLELDITGATQERIEDIKKGASAIIDIDAFDCVQEEESLVYTAKESLFMDGFNSFIKRQYEQCGAVAREGEKLISEIGKISSFEQAIELSDGKMWQHYQKAVGYVSVRSGFNNYRGECSIIGLFIEGKASLECYKSLFSYIENLIKRGSPYPVSRFTKVLLT